MENDPRNDLAAESRNRLVQATREKLDKSSSLVELVEIVANAEEFYDTVLLAIFPEDGLSLRRQS